MEPCKQERKGLGL